VSGRIESGQISAFVVVIAVPLVAVAGLVVDGGAVLAAHQEAISTALEAARAGAQAVDVSVLRSNGTVVLDQSEARAEALSYLSAAGVQTETVSVAGDDVTVTVTKRQPLAVLSAFGIGPVTVSGTATATAVQGVDGANQ